MEKFIPLSVPNLKGNELKYTTEAIEQEWVSTGGAFITKFESEYAAYAKQEQAVATQSGSAALHLALLECGVSRGDLVIAPALTFIAAINPIRYLGADPVFIDCDDSLCMDMQKLHDYLQTDCRVQGDRLFDKDLNRPITAIVVVHVFGNGADMEALISLAERYNLPVVEDATEALGTFYTAGRYTGKMCGTIGDISASSFNGNKIITTGGGGMLAAKDQAQLAHMRYLSTQAKDDTLYFVHNEVGYNYRMTNLQAAIGVAQLEQLEAFIETKKRNYEAYRAMGVELLPFSDSVRPNYWFYSHLSNDRDGLMQYLQSQNIQTRPIWKLNHQQKPYEACKAYRIERAEYYYERTVNLPCSSNLTQSDVQYIAEEIQKYSAKNI